MQGPDGSLWRARSTALVAAVAALLTSVGTMTAHADSPAPPRVGSGTTSVVVTGIPQLEEIAAVLAR